MLKSNLADTRALFDCNPEILRPSHCSRGREVSHLRYQFYLPRCCVLDNVSGKHPYRSGTRLSHFYSTCERDQARTLCHFRSQGKRIVSMSQSSACVPLSTEASIETHYRLFRSGQSSSQASSGDRRRVVSRHSLPSNRDGLVAGHSANLIHHCTSTTACSCSSLAVPASRIFLANQKLVVMPIYQHTMTCKGHLCRSCYPRLYHPPN